jgi:hypothetical protein
VVQGNGNFATPPGRSAGLEDKISSQLAGLYRGEVLQAGSRQQWHGSSNMSNTTECNNMSYKML